MQKKEFAARPFDPANWPFFYGWVIIFMGTIGMLMSIPGQTMGVATFTDYLIDAIGISRDQLSLAYMIGTIGSSLILTRAGRLYDKYGVRPIAVTASILLGLTLTYLSQIDRIIKTIIDPGHDMFSWVAVGVTVSGFFLLRFFGQGVITLVSRTMMMKWFNQKRGFATGFSNVFVSLGFSISPYFFETLIQDSGWRITWQLTAMVLIVIFPLIILTFFRNSPEDSNLLPDGNFPRWMMRKGTSQFKIERSFNLGEATSTFTFWCFSLALALQGFFITGFTFHVVSIFEIAGYNRDIAVGIFQPSALIAILTTLLSSSISDYIELRYLLFVKCLGASLAAFGVIFLGSKLAYMLITFGLGIMGGLYAVILSVSMPRFFGNDHLGAISGKTMMLTVFASALGPILFSTSLTHLNAYSWISGLTGILFLVFGIGSFWARNPQLSLKDK
jgi:OFA family oxalate/formate antiporter-like MFS transporter